MTIHSSEQLDPVGLERQIAEQLGNSVIQIKYLQQCESTNVECMQLETHGGVVIAEQQTAGRGRRGRVWHSRAIQNIYCSIGIEKALLPEFLGLLSLQVGVCVAEVLHGMGFHEVSLKWPNDILLKGRKLGGVLTETRANGADNFFLVIGLGLNTTLDADSLSDIDRPAISLGDVTSEPLDRQKLLAGLISHIFRSIDRFKPKHAGALIEQFTNHDSLYRRRVSVFEQDKVISGLYRGLDRTGQIQIETEQGLQSYAAAEISLREGARAAD